MTDAGGRLEDRRFLTGQGRYTDDSADALGVRHIDMPATPERVWRALRHR